MITAITPSRGRPELLKRSIASLMGHAAHPNEIEVVVRMDYDDPTAEVGYEATRVIFGEPLGYVGGMATYYNECAEAAAGDWLLIWNDDAIMQTSGWDEVIESRGLDLKNLSINNNHGRQYACFPCVPRRWFEICGHLSLDTRVDSWLQAVAIDAGCFVEENGVYIHHDRHDLTGNNDDETYQKRYIDPSFWTSFDAPQNQDARARDAALIRAARQ